MSSMAIKSLTHHNLMVVIHKIEAKGYDFSEAERLARSIFNEFAARPQGMNIEERVRRILTKEEFEAQYHQ